MHQISKAGQLSIKVLKRSLILSSSHQLPQASNLKQEMGFNLTARFFHLSLFISRINVH